MTTVTFNSSGNWTAPTGVTSVSVECWGSGGNGGTSHTEVALRHDYGGGGGGGGGHTTGNVTVVPGHTYSVSIGGGSSSFQGVSAGDGANANLNNGGGGGSPGGGNGVTVGHSGTWQGGAGGSCPSGGAGGQPGFPQGQAGSVPGGGGGGGQGATGVPGGAGAHGRVTLTYTPSGGGDVNGTASLTGAGTLVAVGGILGGTSNSPPAQINPGYSWLRHYAAFKRNIPPPFLPIPPPAIINGSVALSSDSSMTAFGSVPNPVVVNQWSNSYGQGTTFTSLTSALQSCVVPLNPVFQTGPGTGTPSAGNWLFALISWTQAPAITNVHVGVGDDIHSWWREFPASGANQNVRTTIAYVPNVGTANFASLNPHEPQPLPVVPTRVYVAPDGEIAAINVLVVEINGLGPWDTVSGTTTAYAAASTSLNLNLGAPAASSFVIAAVGGDNANTGTFLPSGWQPLAQQTQSNGSNTLADNILNAAFLPQNTSSVAVSGTSSPAQDLSGFMLSVYLSGTNPIPANQNPNWPFVIFEAGFGAGFNTPDSEITWTDISSRLWGFEETTGIQFQLGQLQSSNATFHLDDVDGFLIPTNASSPYFPNVQPGTPLRLRAALGTMVGVQINRWYVIQRNATQWGEGIDEVFRRYSPVAGSDIWAALSVVPPTFYRSEILEDNPYAWWPLDDQPGSSGVLPVRMLNAAVGNTNTLNASVGPNKGAVQFFYDSVGNSTIVSGNATNNTSFTNESGLPPGLGIYASGTNAGWMFGDPQSPLASTETATGNPATATPGSASWQASGQAGTTGANGWYLSCNDANFPPISGGVTIEVWFNVGYYGSGTGWTTEVETIPPTTVSTFAPVTQQPYNTPITIWEMATNSGPVALLQLTAGQPAGATLGLGPSGGALNLIIGGTSHSIYTASDLRDNSWHMVTVTLTTSSWQCWLDGGANAQVSGSASVASAWNWLILNGDFGSNGGSTAGNGLGHGANIALSHVVVFPYVLPYYRVLDHYWAAATAFGQLPAPQGVKVSWAAQQYIGPSSLLASLGSRPAQNGLTADGSIQPQSPGTPTIGYHASNGVGMAAVVVATAPGVTSGPSAWSAAGTSYSQIIGTTNQVTADAVAPFITWTGVAPKFNVYTSSSTGGELEASVTAGNSEAYASGFGSSATGFGVSNVSHGNGSAPPPSGTTIGDTVGQRIERLMRNGRCTSPNRSIDPGAQLVQAPGVNGGTQAGTAIQQIQQSDSGLLFVDNLNHLTYWERPHLASQYTLPVWTIGPTTAGGGIPYHKEIRWVTDPQRVVNAITIAPISPSGAALPIITPTNGAGVTASQLRFGAQPLQIQSWLQNTSEMQVQADWLFANFGSPNRHAEQVRIDAASYPAAWQLVLGINVGDIVQLEDWIIGGGGNIYTFRVTEIQRHITQGWGQQGNTAGEVILTLDFEPPSYWT